LPKWTKQNLLDALRGIRKGVYDVGYLVVDDFEPMPEKALVADFFGDDKAVSYTFDVKKA